MRAYSTGQQALDSMATDARADALREALGSAPPAAATGAGKPAGHERRVGATTFGAAAIRRDHAKAAWQPVARVCPPRTAWPCGIRAKKDLPVR
jgi:hypothetical protein